MVHMMGAYLFVVVYLRPTALESSVVFKRHRQSSGRQANTTAPPVRQEHVDGAMAKKRQSRDAQLEQENETKKRLAYSVENLSSLGLQSMISHALQ